MRVCSFHRSVGVQNHHGGACHSSFDVGAAVIGIEEAVVVEERVELQFVLDGTP